MTPGARCGAVGRIRPSEERRVKVLVAARDVRVRRALAGLLELVDHRTVGAADPASLVLEPDAGSVPEVVVLELDRGHEAEDLRVVERLARRGCSVIGVCSGATSRSAVLAAGGKACLDGDDPGFADRLAETVATVSVSGTRSNVPS